MARARRRGYSLIEIVIACLLVTVLGQILFTLVVNGMRSSEVGKMGIDAQAAGRIALKRMVDDLGTAVRLKCSVTSESGVLLPSTQYMFACNDLVMIVPHLTSGGAANTAGTIATSNSVADITQYSLIRYQALRTDKAADLAGTVNCKEWSQPNVLRRTVYHLNNATNQAALQANASEPAGQVPSKITTDFNAASCVVDTDSPASTATHIYTAALYARNLATATVNAGTLTPPATVSHTWVQPDLLVEATHEDLLSLGPTSGSNDLVQFVVSHAQNPSYSSTSLAGEGEPVYDRSAFGIDLWIRRFYHNNRIAGVGGGNVILRKFSESVQVLDSGN